MWEKYIEDLKSEWLNIEADLQLDKSIKKYEITIQARIKELFDIWAEIQKENGINEASEFFGEMINNYSRFDRIIQAENLRS